MKVIRNKILIEPIPKSEKAFGDFVVPENKDQVALDRGIVIDIGKKIKDVKIGDSIIFSAFARSEFDFKGKKYFVILEEDIIVILNNK